MNNENETMINTEEPLEVSEEEMKMLMEASAQIDRGEVISHEEMEEFFDTLLDDYNIPDSKEETIISSKDRFHQQTGTTSEI